MKIPMFLTMFIITYSSKAESIIGYREACTEEGEVINIRSIKDLKCFTCMCKNGFVECVREHCMSEEGCHRLLNPEKNVCCRKCKGCVYSDGTFHESGEIWNDPLNPCHTLSCMAGVITSTTKLCYTPCHNPVPPQSGQCCPTCIGCLFNGQKVTDNRKIRIAEDPCLECKCQNGFLSCSKQACPVLHCSTIDKLPGECCPHCNGSREFTEPSKEHCMIGNNIRVFGHSFDVDHCTVCRCAKNGTSICTRSSCPILDCPSTMQEQSSDDCCPKCKNVQIKSKPVCIINSHVYKEGEVWQLNQCKTCTCKAGQVRCAEEFCEHNTNIPCPPNKHLVKEPDACCPKCIENDGICTVFGDPHYRTFDGKFYSFQGSCKYQLTADCTNNSFQIRVTNDARFTKTSSWTKTVSIKIDNWKVNLGERRRVKLNGTRISLPHSSKLVNVTNTDDNVLVETLLGVKVLWDGNSFLEVSVPPRYKGKLCGLCGNYNSVPRDDLTTRRGRVVFDADRFGASWRVGGKRACSRQNEVPLHCSSHMPYKRFRDRICKSIRSHIFSECHKKINYLIYFKSCLIDMCECPSRKCYCESLMAYAHECRRLGVTLPDWKHVTGCSSNYKH